MASTIKVKLVLLLVAFQKKSEYKLVFYVMDLFVILATSDIIAKSDHALTYLSVNDLRSCRT